MRKLLGFEDLKDDYYELWEGKNFGKDLLDCINLDEPVMFDTETVGLYGRIRLAQFYQEHWEKPTH